MELRNDTELANTRAKLRRLEDRYNALRDDENEDARVRELSLRSIKSMINQFKEDIARYQARSPAQR